MYLKEVRMENFKSFGRRLTVPFTRGFTAITGPNGSGKSNIGDAILFVLGPRSSKAIRAGKLSELIFNGGKDGQPAKECTVSLVFDNSDRLMPLDADEVVLTRRVRRAPKPDDPDAYYSYFYVNEKASALKEFADLLEHARISADGYNIVTQGSVTNIVQMGNIDRRRIIEQIAGIAEFDNDIEKADKQKADVQANLERIGIVLDEVERNLRQLKKDRDGALRYKELADALAVRKGQKAYATKLDIERRIANTHERIKRLEDDRARALERINKMRGEEREATRALVQVEDDIAKTGGPELQEIHAKVQELRDRRSKAEANANHADDEVQEIARELQELEDDLRRIEQEHHEAQKAATTHEAHAHAVRETAERLEKELTEYRDSVAANDSDAMDVQRRLAELKKTFEKTSAERHEKDLAVDRLDEKIEAAARLLEEAREAERAAQTDIDEIDFQLAEMAEQADGEAVKRLEKELFERKKRQAQVTEEIQDLEKAAHRLRTELAELRAQKEAAEGVERAYSRAVDEVLTARDKGQLKGICGTIAELGRVEAKYGTAIETAAGGRQQCIVTETAADAQEAIEYLRRNRIGRATFLPLDKMTGTMPRGKALMVVKDNASHGFALDLIKFNKRYEKAFQYVFGDTVVVEKLDDARRLMGGVRLVTLPGDLIEASGAMTGGATKGKSSGVGFGGVDASELEKKASELRAAETHVDHLANELSELRAAIIELDDRLRDAKGSSENLETRRKALDKARADAAARLEAAKERAHVKAAETDAAQQQVDAARAEVGRLNDLLADMEAKRESLSRALLASTKKELADRIRKVEADLDAARKAAQDAERKRDVAKETMKLVAERLTELRTRVERLRQEQARHREGRAEFQKEIDGLDAEIETLEESSRETNAAVRALHEARDKVKDRLAELKAQIGKIADQAETGYMLVAKEKDGLPALEEQLGEAMVELRETHYEHVDGAELPPLDDLRREIRRLEADINSLGPINQRALEDYEHQAKRKDELMVEVQHLNEERQALEQLVAEIVKKKKADFMTVYDAINENFKAVYAQLSPGGSGWLKLDDEEDPFSGGLTMMARPKGKRVLRIDAISGGEKSMTALAFIFAVQRYEPSPFYYLDEVDQNLDGVNADMMAKMIRANSREAQFIIVSLRKVTLRNADHIYGVTMQRVGLSEIIGNFDLAQLKDADADKERRKGPLDTLEAGDGAAPPDDGPDEPPVVVPEAA